MRDFSPGRVFLIGAGPGDPELMTLKAARLLQSADVVVHDRLVSDGIMAMIPDGVRLIDVGKMAGHHKLAQDKINTLLVELALAGHRVVRLKGGDPLIFGRGSEEAEVLRAAGIPVEYVPGITAAQGAAAATGVPLTHRGLATGVRYVTGHRAKDAGLDLDWASLASEDTTLVVYMGAANIAEIAFQLMRHGLPAGMPVLAVSGATTPQEERILSTLGSVAADVATRAPEAPVLFMIGRVVELYPEIALADALACEGAGMAAYA
ncbi:MAG: uroporphyrinogen-III C-methyltransferase [Rhodobacteraceae bacterium]|jgi:uroporphyrin-III C-methyltransferase|uniref:uroporphyrinogen-III C-methyltransferase n=1 Tax=Albidovulum sp. TaxID=1872424 RepID=UPI001E00665F|nr:uroporphyrinogen-III C-methyltransferase [uncultured Defluviimonas sp.]MCB2125610.1 uroporphyrinogen-III C-methyltransferase [Paracoccaceae bacterium]MCC0071481.1 uroporphyrinogen-III C-methyltransferase [Paracoccaceae bacterium]